MNFEEVLTLLEVIHSASSAGPKYGWIVDVADAALIEIRDGKPAVGLSFQPEVMPEPEPEPEGSIRR